MPRFVILGAGIAGLSSGWWLSQKDVDFNILEKQPFTGGLARSFKWHDFNCDFAVHRLFTTDENILQQLLQLVPLGRHIRRSRIWTQGQWLRDPLDVLELATHLPISELLRLLWTYATRPRNIPDDSFEHYVIRRYGRQLYRIFFQPYTEKLFGIPGQNISVLWAYQKVRLSNPLDNLRESTKSKFNYFYYPIHDGYGAIGNRLYSEIQDKVLLQATVIGLESHSNRITDVIYQHQGVENRMPVDAVISTLPLTITGRMLRHHFNMHYQKVDAVYLWIDRPLVSDYHWFYFMDADIAINRLVEFKNLSSEGLPQDTTVLCAEVTQEHDDVITKVINDLTKIGLIQSNEILDTIVVREEFAYPIYDRLYEEALRAARQILGQYDNLHLVGRAAEFQHRELDDNFVAASETVEKLMEGLPIMAKSLAPKKELQPEPIGQPRVFVVVLAHNNYHDTQECLQSVVASHYPQLNVVLVDNGSTDGTPENVRKEFPAVHVIENQRNLNVPAGYNVGFSYALQENADYILMLNNDTVVAPNMINELVASAESNPNIGIIMPMVLIYGSDDRIWSIGGRYRNFPPAILMTEKKETLAEIPRLIEYAPGCGLLIHRRAFERAGLFDPGYLFWYDDWDFSERVRAHGLQIQYIPQARMWHKVSRTVRGPRSPDFWRTYGSSAVRFYRRHGRPVWLSLMIHLGYIILRDFGWKRNWAYWPNFWQGIREGLSQPLGQYPLWISEARPLDKTLTSGD